MPGKLYVLSQKLKSNNSLPSSDEKYLPEYKDKVKNTSMNDTELKRSWLKTWPDKTFEKEQTDESHQDDINSQNHFDNVDSNVPLNQLLDKIPLAYSPITKQLHVITTDEPKKILNNKCYYSLEKSDNTESSDDEFDSYRTKALTLNGSGKRFMFQNCINQLNDIEEEKLGKVWNDTIEHSEKKSENNELPKIYECALRTEASSFSSIVSSLSDTSASQVDDNSSVQLNSLDNDDLSIRSHCSQDSGSTCGENSKFFEERSLWRKDINKKKGLSGFFNRNVFTWKPGSSISSQGWKLFSKNHLQDAECSQSSNSYGDGFHIGTDLCGSKKYEDVVASSSALILHNRPANLPAKSLDEQLKHRQEYEQIVEAAKRKEVKESKKRKKQLHQQLKFEEQLSNASKIWNTDILPKWEIMKNTKKTRELWWAGIPPSVRGKIWLLAIKNDLNITHQLYEICVARAQIKLKNGDSISQKDYAVEANKESSVELIQLDISRTFPQLCIFQKGGPYYDILHCLLGAYVCYRPDVGYVQGMSFIAAVLILNLEPADAFICFANLLNHPCHMAFFTLNQPIMQAYYDTYKDFFRENLPKLFQHFEDSSLSPDMYILDWIYSVFAKSMPLDVACRIWDVFLRDGEEFLFRSAIGVLHLYQDKLIKLDFINGAQFLTKLPEDLSADLLFKSIDCVKISIGKLKFNQVLSSHIEKCSPR